MSREVDGVRRTRHIMNSGPNLAIGSSGADVRRLQRILVMLKLLHHTGIDGIFGPQIRIAIESFQQSNGLLVDGYVGQQTWRALPADPNTPELAYGARGSAVSALQRALLACCQAAPETHPGPIDGEFGPQTEAAVRAYQARHGIPASGVVGDETWWAPAGAGGATLASLAGLTTG